MKLFGARWDRRGGLERRKAAAPEHRNPAAGSRGLGGLCPYFLWESARFPARRIVSMATCGARFARCAKKQLQRARPNAARPPSV